MSEPDTMSGPVGGDASAGALLRKAREKQGIHIAALAASIKVAPRKLEALEADRHDELPDATFTRALAQAVCRALKIDPAPVLALLPDASSMVPLDALSKGINTPFRERSAPGANDTPLWMRPALWLPLLVIVAAAVVYWFPASGWRGDAGVATTPASAPARTASAPTGVVQETVVMPPVAPASAASGSSAAPASNVTVTDVPVSPPSTLRLRTTEPSWVEVQDSAGRTLLSRVIDSGESVDLDGSLPLKLRIGNAPATQIVFRGQPVDIGRYTRENIARFELK